MAGVRFRGFEDDGSSKYGTSRSDPRWCLAIRIGAARNGGNWRSSRAQDLSEPQRLSAKRALGARFWFSGYGVTVRLIPLKRRPKNLAAAHDDLGQ